MPRLQLQTIIALLGVAGKTGALIVSQKWSCVPSSWRAFVHDATVQTNETSFHAQIAGADFCLIVLHSYPLRVAPALGPLWILSKIHCSSGSVCSTPALIQTKDYTEEEKREFEFQVRVPDDE